MINPDIRQIGIVVGFRSNNKNHEEKYYVGTGFESAAFWKMRNSKVADGLVKATWDGI